MVLLIFLYIIPVMLTIAVIYHESDEVTRGDLVGIVLISLVPLLNFFVGYLGGLIWFCKSEKVNEFFNTRIK